MGTKVWILHKEFLSKNVKFFLGGEAADLASLARAVPKPLAIVRLVLHVLCPSHSRLITQALLCVSTPYCLVVKGSEVSEVIEVK